MRILENLRAMKPQVPVRTEIIENQQIRNAAPETARNSPGKLDPRILARFGGGLASNLPVSRPTIPVQKSSEEIQPAIPPMPQPQPSSPSVRLTQIPSALIEDPNFPNELKARVFDYINQAADLGYRNISDIEKPIYFDCAMKMIEMKNKIIKSSYESSLKRAAVSVITLNATDVNISEPERIKLFDLMNAHLSFEVNKDTQKIDKFNFIVKAIKFKKNSIKNGLDNLINGDKKIHKGR
jgi:hypothetical protein